MKTVKLTFIATMVALATTSAFSATTSSSPTTSPTTGGKTIEEFLKDKMPLIENAMKDLEEINKLSNKAQGYDAKFTKMETDITGVQNTLMNSFKFLGSGVKSIEEDLSRLDEGVNIMYAQFYDAFEKQRDAIDDLTYWNNEAFEELDDIMSNLDDLSVRTIERLDEHQDAIKKAVDTVAQANKVLAHFDKDSAMDQIAFNKQLIANNITRLDNLDGAVAQQITGISREVDRVERIANNNSARINQLDQRVSKLNNKMKSGFATQAALNGLFQPYNVGKVNVTAALGGYQSKTAIAVGAGYRINQNLAVKTGVAFGTTRNSGTAYNIGVNYEW